VLLLDICSLRQEFNPDGVKAPDDLAVAGRPADNRQPGRFG
jgi:hypothetical protein